MTKQKTLLVFLPLLLIVGNLFCLDSNDWTLDPSCPTIIESKNENCDELVNHPDDDCTSNALDHSTDIDAYNALRPSSCPELISNQEFDNGTTGWVLFSHTGNSASLSLDNNNELSGTNSAKINISSAEGIDWKIQFWQENLSLDASKTYVLSFDAKAATNRTISLFLQERGPTDWGTYWDQTTSLTTSSQSFSYELVPSGNSAANAGLVFNLGASAATVFIDNVSFKEKCEDAEATPPSTDNGSDNGNTSNGTSSGPINPAAQAGQFNFFIEEDMTSKNGDIEGTGAVGGDLTLDGSNTVASNVTGDFQVAGDNRPTGLLIGGRVFYNNGSGLNINKNTYVKVGNPTGSTVYSTNNGQSVLTQITSGSYNSTPRISLQTTQASNTVIQADLIDFTSIFKDFRCYSDGMAQLTANTPFQTSGAQATIQLQSNRVNVVNVTGSQLSSVQGISFNGSASSNSPVVINIDAPGSFNWNIPSFNGLGDWPSQFVILNFYNSTTVVLGGSGTINGSVFAPRAHVDKVTSGNVNGQLIAKSYIHRSGELHHHPFNATLDIPSNCNIVDCDDPNTEKPFDLTANPNIPYNCPEQDNGSMNINASGNNLQYSIDDGNSYQTSNFFDGLTAGDYTVRVKNNDTGCFLSSTVTIADGFCPEVCNNGIDAVSYTHLRAHETLR